MDSVCIKQQETFLFGKLRERFRGERVYNAERHSCLMSHSDETASPEDFLPLGSAVFHILIALAGQDRHGYSIMQDVANRTEGKVKLSPGTLYGAVRRLLESGLIVELPTPAGLAHGDERRRCYRLSPLGHAVASAESARLARLLGQARECGLAPAS